MCQSESRRPEFRNGRQSRPRLGTVLAAFALLAVTFATAATAGASGLSCDGRAATIIGTNDDDDLTGTDGDDVVVLLEGDDVFDGKDGHDVVCGGPGEDELEGGDGNDILIGGPDDDELDGERGDDHLVGDASDDELDGGAGDDTLIGGDGDDDLDARAGDDRLYGGRGEDDLNAGLGNDLLDGGPDSDDLSGSSGDDFLLGGGAVDDLSGGSGNDWCSDLSDDLFSCETEVNDSQVPLPTSEATTTTTEPTTTTEMPTTTGPTTATPQSPTTTESSVACDGLTPTILGTDSNDILVGTGAADVISGLGGNDVIEGLGGGDVICGGPGNDHILGGSGADSIFGQDGADYVDGGSSGDAIYGGAGDDVIYGGDGPDLVDGGPGANSVSDGPPPTTTTTTTTTQPGPTTTTTPPPAATNTLGADQEMHRGDILVSQSGRCELRFQHDQNVVIYDQGSPIWATNTVGSRVDRFVMQGDGNLVLKTGHNFPIWYTRTDGHPGAHLVIQDDCNLVIYQDGLDRWASNTVRPPLGASITLSQGPAEESGYWYEMQFSNFAPGQVVPIACYDAADPSGFRFGTVTMDPSGSKGLGRHCWSGIEGQHWVTGGGVESNRMSWGHNGSTGSPPRPVDPVLSLPASAQITPTAAGWAGEFIAGSGLSPIIDGFPLNPISGLAFFCTSTPLVETIEFNDSGDVVVTQTEYGAFRGTFHPIEFANAVLSCHDSIPAFMKPHEYQSLHPFSHHLICEAWIHNFAYEVGAFRNRARPINISVRKWNGEVSPKPWDGCPPSFFIVA